MDDSRNSGSRIGGAVMTANQAAALAYVFGAATGALLLMWAPYNQNRNVRFHAFQSIFLTVAWLLVVFLIGLVFSLSAGLGLAIGRVAQLAALAGWLLLLARTYRGSRIVAPVVGRLAEKQV